MLWQQAGEARGRIMKQAAKKFDGEAEHPRERDEENTHAQHEKVWKEREEV